MIFTIQNGLKKIGIEYQNNTSEIHFEGITQQGIECMLKRCTYNIEFQSKGAFYYECKTTQSQYQDLMLFFMQQLFYR